MTVVRYSLHRVWGDLRDDLRDDLYTELLLQSYPHQSVAGQIAASGKGFIGFTGSRGDGKEHGMWLDMIRE